MEKNNNEIKEHILSRNDTNTAFNPLLECLSIVTKMYHQPFSRESLIGGLPVVDNNLTPKLFIRAAKKAGFEAKLYEIELDKVSELLHPCVLLLKNGNACILEGIDPDGSYVVVQPETGESIKIDKAKLTENYQGYTIFIKPEYRFEKRSEPIAQTYGEHWFWGTIKKAIPIYVEILSASFLINLFALASPLFIMNVYDRVVPNFAVDTLWVLSIGVLLVFLFDLLMHLLRAYFIDNTSKKIDAHLSISVFEKILGTKLYSLPRSSGTLANMVHSFESFRDFITSTTVSVLVDVPFAIIFILAIWGIGGFLMALVPILLMPTVFVVSLLIQLPLNNLIKQNYRVAAEKHATLIESLFGIETLKSLGAENTAQNKWEKTVYYTAALAKKLHFLSNLNMNLSLFVQHICYVTMVIIGVYEIAEGYLTTGGLIACTILGGRATASIAQFSGIITKYFQMATSLSGIDQLMAMPVDRPKGKSPLTRPQPIGQIEFTNVSFSYPEQNYKVLNGVSFKVMPGEKVGVIGRVGAGKSTIQKLIVGLYQPADGEILIDGVDVQQLDPAEYRRQIAYVGQSNILFYGTVKENIMLNSPFASDEDVLEAAKISGLDDSLRHNLEGFDMLVEEGGKNLSGGQRQMVAIARAFLRDPSIILLDEPTKSMDDHSASIFKKNLLNKLYYKKTLIVISHRSSILDLVNRIIIVDRGKIIADGPKDIIIAALKASKIKSPVPPEIKLVDKEGNPIEAEA